MIANTAGPSSAAIDDGGIELVGSVGRRARAEATVAEVPEVLRLRAGRVIDPASGLDAVADVLIVDGEIVAVAPAHVVDGLLAANRQIDLETVDCRGLIVTPGLIDLHAHVFPGLGDFCVPPDRAGVDTGVPTVVDGGTSGVATFGLARAWLDAAAPTTRVLAFVDPCQLYLATGDFICHKLHIADDERNLDLDATAATLDAHADVVVGMKVRATHTGDDTHSPFLAGAQSVSGGRPVMVHLGRFPHTPTITSKALLTTLRAGDIITHAFRGGGGQLDPVTGAVAPELADAVARGVRLDVGHSGTDFRFHTARRLFDAGYVPHSVSTDLNVYNADGPVGSLVETLSKIWALGVPLVDVIGMGTIGPAVSIHREHELGSLVAGRSAEVSVLRVVDGPAELSDGYETIRVDERLVPVGCVRAGIWHTASDRLGVAA
jgi:dihydroorotase